jgi:septation ring formation regulator EzrA
MTTTDKLREALRSLAIHAKANQYPGILNIHKSTLAHVDALEKELEELRAAVRDLDEHITLEQKQYSALYKKHATTIASCKQREDGE